MGEEIRDITQAIEKSLQLVLSLISSGNLSANASDLMIGLIVP